MRTRGDVAIKFSNDIIHVGAYGYKYSASGILYGLDNMKAQTVRKLVV